MIVNSGRAAFPTDMDVYNRIARLGPGLMLDVGAAVGRRAKLMLRACPTGEVWAFEPFPGNWPHFQGVIGDDPRVRLFKAAASDRAGRERFHVGSVVEPGRGGRWADLVGYSSVGRLDSAGPPPTRGTTYEVETVVLDELLGDRAVTFAKVDVQGAETMVLRGLARALAERRIGVMFVEFGGEVEVLNLLAEHFDLYDSQYVVHVRGDREPDPAEWDIVERRESSKGELRYKGWPRARPDQDYVRWFDDANQRLGFVQCDLVAVRPDLAPLYLAQS
ncbi:FkbM family methyltransferase [Acuticoccus sp. I52.16.1]|uniref:FkbM family methyltransferase n=1 Tax=Acuticoccus sp. I52.16.1 TaxID=2928472 RepID=UPI001FD00402|nr:FkbM family methyltransferase [Acuticoccus sp. I52.16.1]UOM32776.1 FkbM family methyltransferase [Acuticoccus sp. I52.16.1]